MFQNLSLALRKEIAQVLLVASYPKGRILYRQGDPSESLYIVKKGIVELLDSQPDLTSDLADEAYAKKSESLTPMRTLSSNEIFGQYSFLTGSSHQTIAIAKKDCQLEILPRCDFEQLLETSPEFLERTEQILQQEKIRDYLQQRQTLS